MKILFISAVSHTTQSTEYEKNLFKRVLYLADCCVSHNSQAAIFVRSDIEISVINELKNNNYKKNENVKIINFDALDNELNLLSINDGAWYEKLDALYDNEEYDFTYIIQNNDIFEYLKNKNIKCFLENDIGCDFSQLELISIESTVNNYNKNFNNEDVFEIRKNFIKTTVSNDVSWSDIEKKKSEFEKIYLFPLLNSSLLNYNSIGYSDQYKYLDYILSNVEKNIGIFICEQYLYGENVNSEKISILQKKYENLIFIKNRTKVPGYMQSALLHADALICNQKYIAIQATIFGVPVIDESTNSDNLSFKINDCKINSFDVKNVDHLFELFSTQLYLKETLSNNMFFKEFLSGGISNELIKSNNLLSISDFTDSRLISTKVEFCIQNFKNFLNNIHYSYNSNKLLNFILNNDAISFDLFDTLVQRPFTEPHELFGYIEPIIKEKIENAYLPFHYLRRESEHLARKDFQYLKEVTLDQIYEKFELLTQLPKKHIEIIRKIELEAEYNVLSAKKGTIDAWKFCDKLNKPKSIITDIYLDEEFIVKILKKIGIDDYKFLLVSAEYGKMKHDGTLYPEYINLIKNSNNKIISLGHIGDNSHADCYQANNYNINSFLLLKSIDTFKETNLNKMFSAAMNNTSPLTSSIIGLISNKFFSTPDSSFDKESFTDASLYKFGYAILGPFALGFVQWVMRRLSYMKADKAIFLARDSYLPMCIYNNFLDKLNLDLPKSDYLLCSRRSLVVPGFCGNLNSVLENAALNFGNTTYATYLDSRFSISINDLNKNIIKKYKIGKNGESKISFPRDLAQVISLVKEILPLIYKKSDQERKLYLEYLSQKSLLCTDNKYAIIDIGYSGTMQRKLDEITANRYDGLYMLTHNYVMHEFKDKIFEAWLASFDDQRSSYSHPSNDFIPLLESLLSSDGGSLINFSKEGSDLVPNFVFTSNEEDRIRFIREVHRGAIDFSSDYINAFGFAHGSIELSPLISSHPMMFFSKYPSMKDTQTFMGLSLENLFAGYEFDIIVDPKKYLGADGFLTQDLYNLLIDKSKWPEGAKVALSHFLKPNEFIPSKEVENSISTQDPIVEIQRSVNHNIFLSPLEKKLKKLEKDPQAFFRDSKFKVIRPINFLFKPSPLGAFNRRVIKTIINKIE